MWTHYIQLWQIISSIQNKTKKEKKRKASSIKPDYKTRAPSGNQNTGVTVKHNLQNINFV